MAEEAIAVVRSEPGNSSVTYPSVSPLITQETREEALRIEKEQRAKRLDIVDMWREQGIEISG